MDTTTRALPVLQVIEPCPANWNGMLPVDGGRFCSHCQRVVHDLSAMTSIEVNDLICRAAGRLCVRLERASDGAVKTLDYQPIDERRRWTRRWILTGGVVALVAGCANVIWSRNRAVAPPPTFMGKVIRSSKTIMGVGGSAEPL